MRLVSLLIAGLCAAAVFGGDPPAGSQARVPVLVELFTSEGCSSCPPADRLLQKLDREQPVSGAETVVLSEHVDYWNQLGWRDPFSSAQYTKRQRDYAAELEGEVYTPEMVVDGVKGFVGGDEADARRAIHDAAARGGKLPIHIEAVRKDDKAAITIRTESPVDGALYLALASESEKSQVLRGENGGRALSHVAVVYSLQKVGKLGPAGAGYARQITVNVKPGSRIVAFAARGGLGQVTAIGWARL